MAFSGGAGYRPPAAPRSNGGATLPRISNGGARPPRMPRVGTPPGFNGGARAPVYKAPAARPPRVVSNGGAAAPAPAPGGSAGAGGAAAPPLDAEYYNALAQAQATENQKVAALQQQNAYATTQRDQAVQQLNDREPVTEQNLTNAANAKGLLYSGTLGSQIGDAKTAYLTSLGKVNDQYTQGTAARTAQIGALQQGLPLEQLALQLASIDRANAAAQRTALTTPPLPAAATDALGVPRAQGHSTAYNGAGIYRTAGPTNPALRAIGHSPRYRGPGTYVPVTTGK